LDTDGETVTFAYDPRRVTEGDIALLAHEVAPIMQNRWQSCTMRLEKRGGRACESCAQNLERQVGQLPGVRRATASFAGGVMAVHYDDTLISIDDITRRVESLGVGVRPSAAASDHGPQTADHEQVAGGGRWSAVKTWLTPQKLQAILTVVTFVTMMGGWLVERYATGAPAWVATTLC